ncbi:uncharacterized protein LOC122042400 [Zingiber officinale]|uniref:uncharacterized protein LOC122042400 n=1 Tax=Zingiber officinale TaxID=94328 RepID=UPI001C4DC2B5|nr:uncharacterized protein LOC122042400 [Zingiber officinale]
MADKLLKDYAAPCARGVRSNITRPTTDADNFEIKPAVIHMVQKNQFGGGPHEDPNHHLELFYEICGMMKVNEVPPESKFLDKFYPPSKTAHMRNLIASFKQIDSESLFEAWDRFKSMLRQCPHHGLEKWLVLHIFYNGINYHTKNHHQWASERSGGAFSGHQTKASGKFEVDAFTLMFAKLDALTKKFEAMGSNTANAIVCVCDICGSTDHAQDTCPLGSMIENMLEEVLSEQKEMKSEIKQLTQRLENFEKHQKIQDNQIAQIAQSISRTHGTFPGKPDLNPNLKIPFPQKLIASRRDEEFNRFLKKIKEICIEVPLIDVLYQMPKFIKLLKRILSNRRQKGDFETVELTENCNALLMANPPPKLQDPRSFSIPYKIGSELIPRAFCDLEVSVSLLPYSLCKKLGFQNIKLITMTLQLADHLCRYLMGIMEDVLVEVGRCIVPTDFIVLDMEEDPKIPIILGRPFLATTGAIIDVKSHKLSLEIGKEKIEFDLSNSSICNPSSQENSRKINTHREGECSFHKSSPPARSKRYMYPV